MREHGTNDLCLIAEAAGKKRSDRPVDETRSEGLLLVRAPFTLEKTAGNLARRKCLFLIVDGQGKEIDADTRHLLGNGGAEHRGLTIGDEHRAVGLPSDAPGLQNQGTSAPGEFLAMDIEHLTSS